MNWNISFSNYDRILEEYYSTVDKEFMENKSVMKQILQEEEDLTEIVQLVGKESLSEDQKAVLEVAKIIREDFLQQDAFSKDDYNCPLWKTTGMMKCIVKFYTCAHSAIVESQKTDKKLSFSVIKAHLDDEYVELSKMKTQMPDQPKEELSAYFDGLVESIDKKFRSLASAV